MMRWSGAKAIVFELTNDRLEVWVRHPDSDKASSETSRPFERVGRFERLVRDLNERGRAEELAKTLIATGQHEQPCDEPEICGKPDMEWGGDLCLPCLVRDTLIETGFYYLMSGAQELDDGGETLP